MTAPSFRALRPFRPFRRRILLIAALSIVAAQAEAVALILIAPVGLAVAVGETTARSNLGGVSIDAHASSLIGLSLGAVMIAAVFTLAGALLRAQMVAGWERKERDAFIDEFLAADLPTQIATRSGDLQVSFSAYVGKGGLALGALTTVLRAMASIAIYLAASLFIDWRGTLILGLAGGLFAVLLRPVNRTLRATSAEMSTVGLSYADQITGVTASVRDLRIFHAFGVFGDRLRRLSAQGERLHRRTAFLSGITTPVYQYLGLALTLGILWVAVRSDGLNMGAVAAVALLLLRSLGYGQQLQNAFQLMIESLPYFERVVDIRQVYRENHEPDGPNELGSVSALELRGVSYTYEDGTRGLSDINLDVHRGEVIGVVGPSGSGKSTLAQIILRMRAPSSGEYLVDGSPAGSFTRSSFYRHFTLVPQRCDLLRETVVENIRMFDSAVSDGAVLDAAQKASLDHAIQALPNGYDTVLGPSARDLSGGQVQRLAIARAIVRQADVVVLDEPTSALDALAEAAVQQAVAQMAERAAVIVIAHRLSTLSICDRILVLRDGQVEALGPAAQIHVESEYFAHAMAVGSLETS